MDALTMFVFVFHFPQHFWSEIKWRESRGGTEGLSLGGFEARGLEASDNALSLIPPPAESTS